MALAPLAYVLYTRVMNHSPSQPDWPDRDRFVLSCGHASMLLYSTLYLTGYGLTLDDLKNFRQLGSPTAGHPEYGHAAGIETTTGPLGQGISTAVGMALAERMLAERFNREGHEIVDHYTYVIASDGDLQEGVASEASSLAGHLGLGKLISFWDDNHISIEGDTALSFTEDVASRYEAYGWHVQNLGEDIGLDRIENALANAREVTDRPSLIVVRTHIAPGSPNKQDTHGAHGSPLGDEEIKLTKEVYGYPSLEPFFVADEALEHFRACIGRGKELEGEWQAKFDRYKAEFPAEAAEFERILAPQAAGRLGRRRAQEGPGGGRDRHPQGLAGRDPVGRRAGARAGRRLGRPRALDADADQRRRQRRERATTPGRNFHFGIREHGMGAIVNGLNLHGLRAFGAGFFIFSDYMKASLRLAAIMRIPSTFVFTHDSIGVGEDGPTHQPIEQLATLRATPNINVVRPAGFNETALAWRFALNATETPDGARALTPGRPDLGPGRACPTTRSSAAPTCSRTPTASPT